MKKLNQKQWGILGTSLGSVLIIVALLTMVGIGSNDTYAAKVTQCTCTTGTYDSTTNKCIEQHTCEVSTNSSGNTTYEKCGSTTGCTLKNTISTGIVYQCPRYTICNCPTGTKNDGSGNCVATTPTNCPAGQYKTNNTCAKCPAGYYCEAGSTSPAKCPAGHYCPSDGMSSPKACDKGTYCQETGLTSPTGTCEPGYTTSGTGATSKEECVQSTGSDSACTNLSIGATCTTSDGKTGTCIDSGSSSGGRVCKANSSGSDTSYVHCDKGWFYTGDGKTCTKCPSGSWCPGGNFLASSLVRDGGVKCPDDRPYSEPGSYQESDCKASGNGSNTNTNPSTATKTPLVIVIIGMVAMGLGTFTYYKSKNNEI